MSWKAAKKEANSGKETEKILFLASGNPQYADRPLLGEKLQR
jgi:hypothetical protein